jgi:endonuclease YncB( thermonuclease family)
MTRSAELREERLHAEAPPRDVATLTDMITAMPRKPAVIEAVWDGDTQGWGVRLCAVSAHPRSETHLALIRHGSAVLLFDNQVPPWPEAKEAEETGRALARHFGVPFHFASPDTPDDKAPRWWPM